MIELFLFYMISQFLIIVSNKRDLLKVYGLITIGISVLSFFYDPIISSDLYRHLERIEFYGDMGYDWVVENQFYLNPLSNLLLYAFSFLGEPRFFTSFCTFITYGFSFLLLYRVSKIYSLSKPVIVLLTMFLLFNWNYMLVASNSRIFMLYAIIAYFFYMEFVEDRYHNTALFIYISSVFFHYAILLVVIPRLIIYLYKPVNRITYLGLIIIIAFIVYYGVTNSNVIFQDSISEKVDFYKKYNVFGKWQFLNSLLCVLVCCIMALRIRAKHDGIRTFIVLFWFIVIPIFLQLSNFQVIYRESNLVASLSIVLIAHLLKANKDSIMKTVIVIQSIYTIVYSFVYVYSTIDFKFVI